MMTRRLSAAANLAVLILCSSCLSDPETKACIDFAIGTEGCPTGCSVYCEQMLASCPDSFASVDACNIDCAVEPVNRTMQVGEFGERENNTLSCRMTYLREGDCAGASLDVDNAQCAGASCSQYCALMRQNCPDAFPDAFPMFCEDVCETFPRGTSDADANTVECRLKYAALAVGEDAAWACDAASVNGSGASTGVDLGQCGDDPCVPYCDLVMSSCTEGNAVYADRAECMRICGFMASGSFTDWDFDFEFDTVQCRTYHAGPPAVASPETHCPHTRYYNDEHCGITPNLQPQPAGWPCGSYCGAVQAFCPGVYADMAACETACEQFPEIISLGQGEAPDLFPVTSTVCPQP